jgi:hypothetical protein
VEHDGSEMSCCCLSEVLTASKLGRSTCLLAGEIFYTAFLYYSSKKVINLSTVSKNERKDGGEFHLVFTEVG